MARLKNQSDRHALRIGMYQIQKQVLPTLGVKRFVPIKKKIAIRLFCELHKLKAPTGKKDSDLWVVEKYRDESFTLIGKDVKVKPKSKKHHKRKKKGLTKYHKYLLSDEWAQIRIDLFEVRGKKCETCGAKRNIQVHHLTYDNIFNEEPEDLLILCRKCHRAEHDIK